MINTLIDYLLNLIVNELENCVKQNFENYKSERELRKSIDDFKNKLQNWIQAFISKNEASIIETAEFTNYIKHYNFIKYVINYLTDPSSMTEDEKSFLKRANDSIIKYLYNNKKAVTPIDRNLINEFINYIFDSIKYFVSNKLSEEQKIFYYTNQNILKQNQNTDKKFVLPKKKYFVGSDLIERKVISYNYIQKSAFYNLNSCENLYEVCKKEHYVILLGDAGCGKTFALKQTAHYACNDYYTLFIPLSDYAGEEISDLIFKEYPEYKNLPLFLIFDAFDEVRENDRYTFARKLNSFVEHHKNATVLVSARNNFYQFADENGDGSTLKRFKEYTLCPLTQNDIAVYSQNNGVDYDAFNKELHHHRLNSMVYNPFYLKILVELTKGSSNLPSKKELMDEIIKKSFTFDKNKYINPNVVSDDECKLMTLLQEVAFAMQCMDDKVHICKSDYQCLFDRHERTLISCSSLFVKNSNDQWQFEHNNFREYLAAKYLCNLDIEEIKGVICYDTQKTKIRNSWVNVISYLMLIYEDDDLLNWLNNVSESLLVKVERSRIGEDLCNDIFKRIFNSFAEKNAWITRGSNSIEELVEFAQSPETLNFLINEICNPQNFWALSNALVLISHYSVDLFGKKSDVQNVLKECILSEKTRDYEKETAMKALAKLRLDSDEITSILIDLFNTKQTDAIRYGVVCYIVDSNIYEKYIDFLMQQWQYSQTNHNDNAINIIYKIKNALNNIHNKKAIKQMIEYFANEEYHDSNSFDIYTHIIMQANQFYKNGDESFFYDVLNAAIITEKNCNSRLNKLCIDFFVMTNTIQKAFYETLEYIIQNPNESIEYFTISLLINLADDENVEFLKKCYTENPVKYSEVFKRFTVNLNYDNFYLDGCIDLLKSNGIIIEPPKMHIDYDELYRKASQTYFDSLFDKVAYHKLINNLLEYIGNENVTYDKTKDVFFKKMYKNYDYDTLNCKILRYVVDDICDCSFKDNLVKNFVVNVKNWTQFSIYQIYNILSRSDIKINISDEQQKFIHEFCDNQIQSEKLVEEIIGSNDKSYTYNLIFFCFFSSYFNFEYSDEIIRKLTLLPKHFFCNANNDDCVFSEYIRKNLSDVKLLECIQYNISSYTLRLSSQIEHIKFCKQHNKDYALKLAEHICFDPQIDEYDKRVALEYLDTIFKDSENNYKYIYSKFLETDDEKLLNAIVSLTIRSNSPLLIKRLEEENKKSDNKEKYLAELIKLQSQYGLKMYYEIAKEKMSIPNCGNQNYCKPTEAVSKINSVELIPILIKLKDLLFSEGFKDIEYFGLYNNLLHAFQNIAIEHNDEVITSLNESVQNPNIIPNDKAFCNLLISDIEMQVKSRKDIPWNVKKIKTFLKEHEL